ncbi:MAG: hypothetical protein ABL897_02560 [Hyphomicrobium sp.]
MTELTRVADAYFAGRTKARKALLRPLLDVGLVFSVLCILGLALGTGPSSASPNVPTINGYQLSISRPVSKAIADQDVRTVIEIATTSSPNNPDAVFRRTSAQAAWALLMIGLSVVVALNMALFRHMRQAYTPPKRRNPQV